MFNAFLHTKEPILENLFPLFFWKISANLVPRSYIEVRFRWRNADLSGADLFLEIDQVTGCKIRTVGGMF